MKRREASAPLRFLAVGFTNTAIGLAVIYLLQWLGGVGEIAANVGGYSVGVATSFLLNRNWTFCHSGAWLPAFARFLLVFAFAYAVNLGTVLVLIDQFAINGYAAQAFGVPAYAALFYLGSRYVAFPTSGSRPQTGPWQVVPGDSAVASPIYPAVSRRRVTMEGRMPLDTERRCSATATKNPES
jgi:putative flippase GtrA